MNITKGISKKYHSWVRIPMIFPWLNPHFRTKPQCHAGPSPQESGGDSEDHPMVVSENKDFIEDSPHHLTKQKGEHDDQHSKLR